MIEINEKIREVLLSIIVIFIAIFGLFVAYQIIRVLLGGSWNSEDIILAMLFFNISITLSIGFALAKNCADLKHVSRKTDQLIDDFKKMHSDLKELSMDFKIHLKEHRN